MPNKAKRKQAQHDVNVVAAQFGAILWGFIESADAGVARSASAMTILSDMYATLTAEAFTAEVALLFGNGVRGKENVKGRLIDELEAKCKAIKPVAKDVPVSARSFVSQVRTVALSFSNEDVRKASARGTRAAYDVAKPKATTEKTAEPKAAKTVTLPELIAEMTAQLGGLVIVAKMMESSCIARKDTIRAQVCHEFATKLAAAG